MVRFPVFFASSKGNMASFRQEDIDGLFTDLKVIGSVQANQRLATLGTGIRIDTTAMLGVWRTLYGENRTVNLQGVKRALTHANTLIDLSTETPLTEDKRSFLHRIYVELENTVHGLENLKATYEGDVATGSTIDVYIENIANKRRLISTIIEVDSETS